MRPPGTCSSCVISMNGSHSLELEGTGHVILSESLGGGSSSAEELALALEGPQQVWKSNRLQVWMPG